MKSDTRVRELDGLRGIACLLVVLWHCVIGASPPFREFIGPTLSAAAILLMVGGVDLFFVLSGFLIGGILLDHRSAENFFSAFWRRRAGRILPVYVLLLATYVAALSLRPHLDAPWLDDFLLLKPLPLWTYLTFTQNFAMTIAADPGALWVAITWSLAIEEQFYVVFPGLVRLMSRRALIFLALGCVVAAPIFRILSARAGGGFYALYFPTPGRLDALMCGVLVACIVRSDTALSMARRLRPILDALAVAVLAALIDGHIVAAIPGAGFSLMAVMFSYAILRIFIADEKSRYRALLCTRPLVAVGLISYALYMYHQAVNGLVHGLLFGGTTIILTYRQFAAALLVLAISVTLAALSTRYFERPFRDWAKRKPYRATAFSRPHPPASAASPSIP